MEEVLDRLRILNYHQDFCGRQSGRAGIIPPFNITTFNVVSTNPNEQFYFFSCICVWLIRLCGHQMPYPEQFDDPNNVCANISTALKEVGISFEHGMNKLRQPYGEIITTMLVNLCDKALSSRGFKYGKITHKVEDTAEEAEVDADAEVTTDAIEEDLNINEDDQEEVAYMDTINGMGKDVVEQKPQVIIQAKINAPEWKLEVERVTPHLRIQLTNDNKDWRIHLDSMTHYFQVIKNLDGDVKERLKTLKNDIEKGLEKIVSREKYINTQFEGQIEEYKHLQDSMSDLKQKYNVAGSNVQDLTIELSRISEELDTVKSKMDDIGSGMTDSKPLVNIKQGIARLKSELKQMDLRVGVIQHTLLATKMRNRGNLVNDRPQFTTAQIFAIHIL